MIMMSVVPSPFDPRRRLMFTLTTCCVTYLFLGLHVQGFQFHLPPHDRSFVGVPSSTTTCSTLLSSASIKHGNAFGPILGVKTRKASKFGAPSFAWSASSTVRALARDVDHLEPPSPASSSAGIGSQRPSSSREWVGVDPGAEPTLLLLTNHPVLGDVRRIRVPGQEDFVAQMAVPTYACGGASPVSTAGGVDYNMARDDKTRPMKLRGLEAVVEPGPAFVLDNILSPYECEELVEACEALGFGNYRAGKNHHGALQLVVSEALARRVSQRLARYVNVQQVDSLLRQVESALKKCTGDGGDGVDPLHDETHLEYRGLNRRWRVYRYEPGGVDHFAPHIDAGFPPSGLSEDGTELVWDCSDNGEDTVSRLTILFYLNDDFQGGHTNFFAPVGGQSHDGAPPPLLASVRPVAGSCLVFPQGVGEDAVAYARENWPLHEGSPVAAGSARPKYVIRSDVMFATVREAKPSSRDDDPLFRHDAAVKRTFLPASAVIDANFQSHIDALYNPHMGVENLGPFLFSFVRFTKVRHVLEIGAGYTTLWILQALRDNQEEMERIHKLQESGQCRLLDWPWTNEESVNRLVDKQSKSGAARLLCVDNCEHQKQTASGAAAVARELGLDSYLQFQRGDAFDLELKAHSLDVVWCDFGVGSRMRDFCSSTWDSIRPGGFLLCHSTLTNQRTRDWLEAARSHRGVEATGIPAGDYVELSLLEPHKHYQNSISIFQKRRGYTEPVYSEFA